MSGIAAAFGKAAEGRTRVKGMLKMIGHRGPDGSGVFSLGSSVLGHARLSIIDVETGRQPIINESGDLAISVDGAVCNFWELKRGLTGKHRFSTRTDAEVILHLFEELKEDSLPLLDGMFSFVIAGPEGFIAARDPLGIKPLYIGNKGGLVLLASEMKAFPEGMEKMESVPAGHYSVNGGRPEKFCSPLKSAEVIQKKSRTEIKKDIKTLLKKAVTKNLIADVPVGVSLSGGLDSSLVAAIMKKHVKELHSFTAGMKDSPDILKARQAARHLGTRHHELIYTKADMKKVLEEVIWHLESFDAPLVRSAIPMFFVSSLAAEHVKVILSGEGADELFAGYSYFSKYRGARLRKEMNRAVAALQDTNLQRADRISMAHGLEARVPFLDYRLLRYSLGIPLEFLERNDGAQEKQVLREAFEGSLPPDILFRPKMKFSVGAGSSGELFRECSEKVTDRKFSLGKELPDGSVLRSKEEYHYHEVFRNLFGDRIPPGLVGRTVDRSAGTERERR